MLLTYCPSLPANDEASNDAMFKPHLRVVNGETTNGCVQWKDGRAQCECVEHVVASNLKHRPQKLTCDAARRLHIWPLTAPEYDSYVH